MVLTLGIYCLPSFDWFSHRVYGIYTHAGGGGVDPGGPGQGVPPRRHHAVPEQLHAAGNVLQLHGGARALLQLRHQAGLMSIPSTPISIPSTPMSIPSTLMSIPSTPKEVDPAFLAASRTPRFGACLCCVLIGWSYDVVCADWLERQCRLC
eukprot:6574755-Pyramimonas_sp.AAC.1